MWLLYSAEGHQFSSNLIKAFIMKRFLIAFTIVIFIRHSLYADVITGVINKYVKQEREVYAQMGEFGDLSFYLAYYEANLPYDIFVEAGNFTTLEMASTDGINIYNASVGEKIDGSLFDNPVVYGTIYDVKNGVGQFPSGGIIPLRYTADKVSYGWIEIDNFASDYSQYRVGQWAFSDSEVYAGMSQATVPEPSGFVIFLIAVFILKGVLKWA